MKQVTDFLPRVIPSVQGCPEPMAVRAVVDSAIAFCEESLVLREKQDAFSTVANTVAYDLDAPVAQQVARVLNVWVDGTVIDPIPSELIGIVDTRSTKPTGYYTTRVDSQWQLNLSPTPDAAYSVVVEVALRPTRDAKIVQDDLYNLWIEPIVAGAVGRLMSTPQQPFSDPVTGEAKTLQATAGSRKARVEGTFGRVKSSQRVAPRPLA